MKDAAIYYPYQTMEAHAILEIAASFAAIRQVKATEEKS